MLHETYRPRDWAQVAGQDKAVAMLRALEERGGLQGRAYWVSGRSGNGKTTLARIIAGKVSTKALTMELDAGELTAGTLRDIQDRLEGVIAMVDCPLFDASFAPNAGKVLAVIVNEAHGLSKLAARVLLKLLESPYIDHAVFVFTTTLAGQATFEDAGIDSTPLLRRCLKIKLAERDVCKAAAVYLRACAQDAGLDGKPVECYERLFHDSGSNFGEAFGRIEGGAMLA